MKCKSWKDVPSAIGGTFERGLELIDPGVTHPGKCQVMENEVALSRHAAFAGDQLTSQMTLDMANILVLIQDLSGVLARLNELRSNGDSEAEIERKILNTDLFFEFVELSQSVEINERLAEVIGAESRQDAVDRFQDAICKSSHAGYREYFISVLHDCEFETELELRHLQTGEPLYFQFRSRIDRRGDYVYGVSVLAEITEQVELSKEVERSESRMQMAIEASQAGILEVDVPTMTMQGNDTYYELLGHPRGSLDGPVSHMRSLVHPDDFQESVKLTSAVLAGELAILSRKVRIRLPSGRYRWYLLRLKPTKFGDDAKPLKAIGTMTDVHDEECTDRLLRLERDVLGMRGPLLDLLETLAVGIEQEWDGNRCIVIKFDSETKDVSHCIAPSLGDFMRSRILGLAINELREPCRQAIQTKKSICFEWGSPFDQDEDCPEYLKSSCKFTTSTPIFVGDEIQGVVCILHVEQPSEAAAVLIRRLSQTMQFLFERQFHADKEAEFEAKVLTEDRLDSLGKLAGGIAHDFNNLLTVMLSHTELIELCTSDSEIRKSTAQITEAARMATNLCRKMLTYAGESSLELTDFDLSEIASTVVDIIRCGTSAGHEFRTNFTGSLPSVTGDKSIVSQLILNLLTNAVEATIKPGLITVETGHQSLKRSDFSEMYFADELTPGDYLFVRVIDCGCGMTPEVTKRIFDPFFTTKETGSGLGLATVVGAVRRHNGCLALESEPTVGTSITAFLPAGNVRVVASDERKRVAIVDDNDAVRTALEKILTRQGYDVVTIASGEEALQRVHELGQCDLLLLDQQMPGMNGMETFVSLRKQLRALPVCFISGYKIPPEISNLVRVDKKCKALLKPFSSNAIDETVKHLIGVE